MGTCPRVYKEAPRDVASSVAMDGVISKIHRDGNSLRNLTRAELAILPASFIEHYVRHDIHYVWDLLPDSFTSNPDMSKYRRCLVHYNLPVSKIHIDGPPPMIKDCYICNYAS